MEVKTTYFWCIVPHCTNTSIKTPEKVFIHVPKDPKTRRLWLLAARRDPKEISAATSVYCCEDHFDVSEFPKNHNTCLQKYNKLFWYTAVLF